MSGAHIKRAPYAGCPGKSDFAYNRIDFRQKHSVGYGFVNCCRGWLLVFVNLALGLCQAGRGRLLHQDIPRHHMKPSAAGANQISHSFQGLECLAPCHTATSKASSALLQSSATRPPWRRPRGCSSGSNSRNAQCSDDLGGLSEPAPAFNPISGMYQPPPPPGPPPYTGGSSSSGSPPAPEGDRNGHRANEGRSGGSSSREGQPSDDTGPVIANGSTTNKKGSTTSILTRCSALSRLNPHPVLV